MGWFSALRCGDAESLPSLGGNAPDGLEGYLKAERYLNNRTDEDIETSTVLGINGASIF
jgi:hypothetical protein